MNSQIQTSIQAQAQEVKYFDLTTEGVGYLNRVRIVTPKKATHYLACTIKALCGPADDVEYRECDLIVVGSQARLVVEQLEPAVAAQKRVIVGFRFGDAAPNAYDVKSRDNPDVVEQRLCIKGRLLQITFAKIDGEMVDIPKVERKAEEAANDTAAAEKATGTHGPVINTGSAGV